SGHISQHTALFPLDAFRAARLNWFARTRIIGMMIGLGGTGRVAGLGSGRMMMARPKTGIPARIACPDNGLALLSLVLVRLITTACPAQANINLELRPASGTITVGGTANLGLYAVSDNEIPQLLSATQAILTWNTAYVQLAGL